MYLLIKIMDVQQKENNQKIREIRRKRSNLNIRQKSLFEKVFLQNAQPDFRKAEYYELIQDGIPSEFRIYVWTQLIPNYFNVSPLAYSKMIQQLRAFVEWLDKKQHKTVNLVLTAENSLAAQSNTRSSRQNTEENPENNPYVKLEKSIKTIKQDIPRTFPQLKIFRTQSQQASKLFSILGVYSIFRWEAGYIQGLSSIAALLLQQLTSDYRTFIALTTLVSQTILNHFFSFDSQKIGEISSQVLTRIQKKQQGVHGLLSTLEVDLKPVIIGWVMTLFTKCFQLDSILNMWDILFINMMSQQVIVQLCSVIIVSKKQKILEFQQQADIVQFLNGIKLTTVEEEIIFQSMRQI